MSKKNSPFLQPHLNKLETKFFTFSRNNIIVDLRKTFYKNSYVQSSSLQLLKFGSVEYGFKQGSYFMRSYKNWHWGNLKCRVGVDWYRGFKVLCDFNLTPVGNSS